MAEVEAMAKHLIFTGSPERVSVERIARKASNGRPVYKASRVLNLQQISLKHDEELISSRKADLEMNKRLVQRQRVVLLYEGLKPFERQVSVFLEVAYDNGLWPKPKGEEEENWFEHVAQVKDDLQVLLELGVVGSISKFKQATAVLDKVRTAAALKRKEGNGQKLSAAEQEAVQEPDAEELELASQLRQVQRRPRDFLSMSYLAKGLLEAHKPAREGDDAETVRLRKLFSSAAADTGVPVFKSVLQNAANNHPENKSMVMLAQQPRKALEVFVELAKLRILQHQSAHPYDSIDKEQPEDLALAVRILEESREEFPPVFKVLIDAGLPFLRSYVRLEELKARKASEEEKQLEGAALSAMDHLF